MADEHTSDGGAEHVTGGRPHYGPRDSGQAGPDEHESVIGDNDLPLRAVGPAGESAGSGVPGLGGSAGGTPDAGGVNLPGGSRRLGEGPARVSDARERDAGDPVPTREDEAHASTPHSGGIQPAPLPAGPDAPVPDASDYDADLPVGGTASRSTPENPVPEEPSPGLTDHPGPEAEI